VLVTDVVLVETIWTLRGKKYGLGRERLASVIQALFKEPNIRFENSQTVWQALNDYRESNADFADALIVNKGRSTINNKGEKFSGFYTFDKEAQKLRGAKKP